MKNLYVILILLISTYATAQCDITPIDSNAWSVVYTDSEWGSNFIGAYAIDGDPETLWHSGNGVPYPHEIQIDLGAEYPVSGIGMLPRQNPTNAKATDHIIYLSSDGSTWKIQGGGDFQYVDNSDVTLKQSTFNSITARYVRLQGLEGYDGTNMGIAEIEIYQDLVCAPTGQFNQLITFEELFDKGTDSDPFDVVATSNTGLDVTFEIASGPATINGTTITLDGTPGIVEVKALQEGDTNYHPTERIASFEVIDLSLHFPDATTRFVDTYPLEMPELKAYPIYVNASIEIPDGLIEIQQVDVEVSGQTYTAEEEDGFYYYLWTPESFGTHELLIHTIGTNGNVTTITRNIEVTSNVSSQTVTTLQDVVIEFGGDNSRWYYGSYTLPQFVGAYQNINASLEVECPNISGGCDDWDRWAHIDIKAPDGNWIQLIRYITPYGVGCNHELDVSDYMSLLQGEFEFRVFIDTWGTGGWQLTLNLDYAQGAPDYDYSGVVEIWDGSYSFGNPANLQPVETYAATIPELVNESYLRLSNTGHGWGSNNSANAAEFFNATHYIDIDGNEIYTQNLWDLCNPNPDGCTGQQGTWFYSRAGWCPGAIAPPDTFDLSNYTGSNIDLDYRFHPTYQDFCHPNNPDCISGTTCPDCNDGYNPVYFIDGQIINKSNYPLIYGNILGTEVINNDTQFDITIYPNPTKGEFFISTLGLEGTTRISVFTVEGRQVKVFYFNSNEELSNYKFDLSSMSSGIYFINLENEIGTGAKKIIIE